MITLRKLRELKPGTRFRRAIALLGEFEADIVGEKSIDFGYLTDLFKLLAGDEELSVEQRRNIERHYEAAFKGMSNSLELRRACNDVRNVLLRQLGSEPADWDFSSSLDFAPNSTVYPIQVYLEDLRSPFNVGSVFRVAAAFGLEAVLLSSDTPDPGALLKSR